MVKTTFEITDHEEQGEGEEAWGVNWKEGYGEQEEKTWNRKTRARRSRVG